MTHPAPIRGYRYDLRTGDGVEFTGHKGFPALMIEWEVSDGVLASEIADADRRIGCLIVVEIETLDWRKRWCGPRNWLVDWPRLGPDATVTFRLQEQPRGRSEPCVRLLRTTLGRSLEPTEIPLHTKCKAFSGAGTANWTVWSEQGLRAQNIRTSKGYALLPTGSVVNLGRMLTGSISTCGKWAYWQRDVPVTSSEQLLRWRPGSPIQIVFETKADSLLGHQECHRGWLTVSAIEHFSVEASYAYRPDD